MRRRRRITTLSHMTTIAPSPESKEESLFTRAFVLLAVADLAYFTAAGVAIYALPLYVTGPLGSNKAAAGVAFGAFAVSALMLRPLAGRWSDTVGRLPLMIGGALLAAVGLFLTAFVHTVFLVVLLRLLLGVAEAAFFVASIAALADLAPPSRIGEALSFNSLGLYLGLAAGPPLGEVMVETWSFTTAWVGAAVLALMAAGIVLGVGETRTPIGNVTTKAKLIHRKAIPVGLAFFTSLFAMGAFLAFASLHAEAVGLRNTSLPLLVYGLVVVVCRIAFARLQDKAPALLTGAAALATIALGLALIGVWTTPAGLILGVVLLGLGITFSTPAFFAAIFATAGPGERGAASGTASAFLDLGLGGGPMVLGFVAQGAGIPSAFAVAALVALAGSVWTLALRARATRGQGPVTAAPPV